MVEITDRSPLSIGRELDVIVLREVRADLKALHRPSRPAGIAGQAPHSFFYPEEPDIKQFSPH